MTPTRSRAEPQFFNVYDLPWEIVETVGLLAGLEQRMISHDTETGASTHMARIRPGWHTDTGGLGVAVEFVVVEGQLAVDGQLLKVGGYARIPAVLGSVPIESELGCQAYVFLSSDPEAESEATVRTTSFWDEPWEEGLLNKLPQRWKSLRLPDPGDGPVHGGPRGLLRVMQWLPGFIAPMEHVHSVWEELIFLSGDWIAGEWGAVAPGSYLSSPAGFWHAPVSTRTGALAIVHSDLPLDLTQRDCEGGPELTRAYLDETSMLELPKHEGEAFLARFGVSLPSKSGAASE